MSHTNATLFLFFCFALGLPLWAMQANKFDSGSVHACTGDCYKQWQQETGGIVAIAATKAAAAAAATPEELGKTAYSACIACHGNRGQGGVGPALAGQPEGAVYNKLVQYKNGETRGKQSALMWAQASTLSDTDMKHIGAFVASLSNP